MDRDSKLERIANAGGPDARTDAAPKSRVEQNHINRGIENIRGQLFKVDNYRVGCERQPNLFSYPAHAAHTEDWIFQIVIANVFNLLPEPDRGLSGPYTVWI